MERYKSVGALAHLHFLRRTQADGSGGMNRWGKLYQKKLKEKEKKEVDDDLSRP